MDTFCAELRVNLNAPASESSAILSILPISQLSSLRNSLFAEAASQGLTSEGDELMSRRDTKKKPLNAKLNDDITTPLFCPKIRVSRTSNTS